MSANTVESNWVYLDELQKGYKKRIYKVKKFYFVILLKTGECSFELDCIRFIRYGFLSMKGKESFRQIAIDFPDDSKWDYDLFMLAMKDYNIDVVDWFYVMKVMVGVKLGGTNPQLDASQWNLLNRKSYEQFAECKSFEWFVGEYLKYIYIDKCEKLDSKIKQLGMFVAYREGRKELDEWMDKYESFMSHDYKDYTIEAVEKYKSK